MTDPVAHLKQCYLYPDKVVDRIYNTLLPFAGAEFIAVNYTEKCLRNARMLNVDPIDEMRGVIGRWKRFGNPVQMGVKAANQEDLFKPNPENQ